MNKALPLLLAAVLAAGCSSTPKSPLRSVRATALAGANLDSATALDLVFVYSAQATPLLPRTGPEWFANKPGLLAGLGPAIAVVELQLPPLTTVAEVPLPQGPRPLAVYSFANYIAPAGQARADLSAFTCAQITLQPQGIAYQACGSP